MLEQRLAKAWFLLGMGGGVMGCGTAHTTDDMMGDRDGGGGITLPRDGGGFIVLDDGAIVRPGEDGSVIGGESDGGAGTHDDGGGRDAGMRPARDDGRIGTACMSADDCDGRFCTSSAGGLGYCSWVCADDIPCPDDAVCVEFDPTVGYGYCLAGCGPDAPAGCPTGTVCTSGFGLPAPVCLAGCERDSECPMGTACGMGFGGVGRCFTPDAESGQPCVENSECAEDAFCADEASWGYPAGICIRFGCNAATGSGCDASTVCIASDDGGLCLPRCDGSADCRSGYQCTTSPVPDVDACVPRCSRDDECTAGRYCDFLSGNCYARSR